MDQRHEWFLEGAQSFRSVLQRRDEAHLLPPDVDVYPCPVCLTYFTIEAIEAGELTREHVPPKSQGGRWLVLTCRTCNTGAGRFFDGDAERQERMRSFLAGQHEGMVRGSYTVNGVSSRGEMHRAPALGDGPGSMMIVGPDAKEGDPVLMAATDSGFGVYFQSVAKINSPEQAQQFEQALNDAVDGQQLNLSYAPNIRFSAERASASWIRSAYLVAFAALGWSYILEESLEQVREQLQARENADFPAIGLYDGGANPDRQDMAIINDPPECESLMVAIGAHAVFLPMIGKPSSLTDLAGALEAHLPQANNSQTQPIFNGFSIPWPTKPEYRLDGEPR